MISYMMRGTQSLVYFSKVKEQELFMKRREAREKALQALFQIDVGKVEREDALEHVVEELEADPYLIQLVNGTTDQLEKIDSLISSNLENWKMDRLSNIDRNILRLTTYELLFNEEVPQNAAINEAIELAKLFGDDQSPKFINAVLSKIKESL